MKKLIAILLVSAIAFPMQAQKAEKGDWGLGFNVTGLANIAFTNSMGTGLGGTAIQDPLGLFPAGTTVGNLIPQQMFYGKFFLADDLALRTGLGINSLSSKMETKTTDPSTLTVTTMNNDLSAFSFGINVGAEKHFAATAAKIDPYAGIDIAIGMLGSIKNENIMEVVDTSGNSSKTTTNTDYKGGMTIYAGLLAGFNYFFTDKFAIGAEMSWGFQTANTGGDWTQDVNSVVNGTSSTSNTAGTQKVTSGGFRVGSTAGVNATVFF